MIPLTEHHGIWLVCGGFILLFASFYYFYEGLRGRSQEGERSRREDSAGRGRDEPRNTAPVKRQCAQSFRAAASAS